MQPDSNSGVVPRAANQPPANQPPANQPPANQPPANQPPATFAAAVEAAKGEMQERQPAYPQVWRVMSRRGNGLAFGRCLHGHYWEATESQDAKTPDQSCSGGEPCRVSSTDDCAADGAEQLANTIARMRTRYGGLSGPGGPDDVYLMRVR